MGYTTDFSGRVSVTPPLNAAEVEYLTKFSESRRMDRSLGPYYVDGSGFRGQGHDADIKNFNTPPAGQPSLWCGWIPTPDGTAIEWDGTEKFYASEEWMQYLIDHFLKPGGLAQGKPGFGSFTFDHVLSGRIEAEGEERSDVWTLVVEDNRVSTRAGLHGSTEGAE